MKDTFEVLPVLKQLDRTEKWVNDPRGVLPTGLPEMDDLLFRGGLAPETFVVMGGRQHTRKTTVALNMIARWLRAGRYPLLVGLDESNPSYTLKLMSALYGAPHEAIADNWNTDQGAAMQEKYKVDAANFCETHGYRPDTDTLSAAVDEYAAIIGRKPEVVVIDYISLMDKGKYGNQMQKVVDTIEAIQVWTRRQGLVTVALTQVGRDGGPGGLGDNEGHIPLAASDLKFGGEEIADIVWGTYRPALDPIGNLDYEEAQEIMPESWTEDKKFAYYERRRTAVETYQHTTFLQQLKNRPGTKLFKRGIQLRSEGEAMRMQTLLERGKG